MLRLNFKPASARHELARDEAMLQWADGIVEQGFSEVAEVTAMPSLEHVDTELFRVWRFAEPTVILGRSSKIDEEVHRDWCRQRGIDVLRRCTGGASVVGGPGCLMYSVVVRVPASGGLRNIDAAHDFVMQRVLAAVCQQLPDAERRGTCDLAWQARKFSGNSLRVARHHLLYHGTLLLAADLDLIADCLAFAPRQPEYRQGRYHRDFIDNVDLDETLLVEALSRQFGVVGECGAGRLVMELESISNELFRTRYDDAQWHERR